MGVLLGLLAAIAYGASDFAAGVGSRRASSEAIAILSLPFGLAAAVVAVVALDASSPTAGVWLWGAFAGLGGGVGTLALYRGLAVGRMSVVAPLSAVLTAALPAAVGIVTGDSMSVLRFCGLGLALPAIALVSRESSDAAAGRESGFKEGLAAGVGFAVLFIGLDRAGTDSGAWPLIPGEIVALVVVGTVGLGLGRTRGTWRAAWWPAVLTGIVGGSANLLYLAATGHGQLSVVAVVTALYPAVTILLARTMLHERWARIQGIGLGLCGLAVVFISFS